MSRPRLGKKQRGLLVAIELYRRQHGQAPTWWELREALGLRPAGLASRLEALRQQGLVEYTAEPRSLRVTPEGIDVALGGKGPRPA